MKNKTAIKIIISSILGIIIDQSLSITDIIRESIEPFLIGPFLYPIRSIIILCFFVAEIAIVYSFLFKLVKLDFNRSK